MNKAKSNTVVPAASLREFPLKSSSTASWIIFFFGLTAGLLLILYHSAHTPTYTIDSYFYLSKAKQLLGGEWLTTSWNNGMDPKYFPGYSLVLAAAGALGASYAPVQLIAYLLSAGLLIAALRELNIHPSGRALAATAFSVNPIVIKWYSLPMAEGAALALSLAATVSFLRSIRLRNYFLFLLACLIGGLAVITRIESLFLCILFPILLLRERGSIKIITAVAGAFIFFLPLGLHWISVRSSAGTEPVYVSEFAYTIFRFSFLKNFIYNLWVPFGLMQHAPLQEKSALMTAAVYLATAFWLLSGGSIFWTGLLLGGGRRLGRAAWAAVFLFLAYAGLHALWYYRYERFMLLALPLCAFIWAECLVAVVEPLRRQAAIRALYSVQISLLVGGLALGHFYASTHEMALRRDTFNIEFAEVARTVNNLVNPETDSVLTDLGPHLAYYLDAHSYMDDDHGNYWQRAFAPEKTLESLEKLRIGLIVTRHRPERWLQEHKIPPEMVSQFQVITNSAEGVSIIRYIPGPGALSGS